jgi:hypothetical protein
MEEHTEREEPLSEELLEWVTGASGNGNVSTSNHPGPGSFLHCRDCQAGAAMYDYHIHGRDTTQAEVDSAIAQGAPHTADMLLQWSNEHHQSAQAHYEQMAAHGHPDFPAALRQQRRNYNPPN